MVRQTVLIAVASLILTGCAQAPTPAPTQPSSSAAPSQTAAPSLSPSIPAPEPSSRPTVDPVTADFINAMATTCIYAQGVGVTETVATDGVINGALIMLPKSAAIADGYTAGWIPDSGGPAEVIFESDAFDACAIANTVALAEEGGTDISDFLTVTRDNATDVYTATTVFGDFTRTARYQMGEGGIAYSVIGLDGQGRKITTTLKYGMPRAEHIKALETAVAALFAN